MKKAFVLLFALAAFGCKEIPGTLVVHESFSAQVKRGLFGRIETVQVPTGHLPITLNGTFTGNLQIQAKINGQVEKITLNIPSSNQIPKEEGTFLINSAQLRQPFNLQGEVRTQHIDDHEVRATETCRYPREVKTCEVDRQTGHRSCRRDTEYKTGIRDVAYFPRTSITKFWIEITRENDSRHVLATFQGEEVTKKKVYTYQGICHPRYGYPYLY